MKTKVNPETTSKQKTCPICNETMVDIRYGFPIGFWEDAKQRKVFIGGCIVLKTSPRFHCYKCRKSFSKDLKTNIDANDDWLQED